LLKNLAFSLTTRKVVDRRPSSVTFPEANFCLGTVLMLFLILGKEFYVICAPEILVLPLA
jgi:hypothetical protein